MNQNPTIVPRPPGDEGKPVRDLLEDIHRRSGFADGPRGVLNPKPIDQIAFGATVLSVVICAAALLGIVWDAIDHTFGLKLISSVLIVLFALLIFRSVNRTFSD